MTLSIANLFCLCGFHDGIIVLQLGPLCGPLLLGGEGHAWIDLVIVASVSLVASVALAIAQMRWLSIAAFVVGILVWYGSGVVFLMLTA